MVTEYEGYLQLDLAVALVVVVVGVVVAEREAGYDLGE